MILLLGMEIRKSAAVVLQELPFVKLWMEWLTAAEDTCS